MLNKYWPHSDHGSVLITTRKPKAKLLDYPVRGHINLREFDIKNGAKFLIHSLPGSGISKADAGFAANIVSKLNGNPLLISQVAAIMQAEGLSLEEFFELYEKYEKNSKKNSDFIWDIIFECLEGEDLMLLDSLSYLISDYIPGALIEDLNLTSKSHENYSYGKPPCEITHLHSWC